MFIILVLQMQISLWIVKLRNFFCCALYNNYNFDTIICISSWVNVHMCFKCQKLQHCWSSPLIQSQNILMKFLFCFPVRVLIQHLFFFFKHESIVVVINFSLDNCNFHESVCKISRHRILSPVPECLGRICLIFRRYWRRQIILTFWRTVTF